MLRRELLTLFSAIAYVAAASVEDVATAESRVGGGHLELFIFARFHARPGNSSMLLDTLLEVSAETKKEKDCISHDVFESTRDPQLFYIHSQWANESAFERHIALPHTQRFVTRVEPLIDHELEVVRTHMRSGA